MLLPLIWFKFVSVLTFLYFFYFFFLRLAVCGDAGKVVDSSLQSEWHTFDLKSAEAKSATPMGFSISPSTN